MGKETQMVKEASLKKIEGLEQGDPQWSRGVFYQTGLETLAQWVEFATGRGFTVTPAPDLNDLVLSRPDLNDLVLSRQGSMPYQIIDPRATPGYDVFFVLLWED